MSRLLHTRASVLLIGIAAGMMVTATAALATVAVNSVASVHVINETLQGVDIKNGTLSGLDLANESIESVDLKAGAVQSEDIKPAAVTTGKIQNGTIRGVDMASASVTTAHHAAVPAVRAERLGFLGTATNNSTPFSMDTEVFDTAGMWDAGTPYGLTAPIDGVYQLSAGVRFADNATGSRALILYDGTISAANEIGASRFQTPETAGSDAMTTATTLVSLQAGDFVQARVVQNSGGGLNVEGSPDNFLAMHWVGPAPTTP